MDKTIQIVINSLKKNNMAGYFVKDTNLPIKVKP